MKTLPVGLQLYTVRTEMEKSVPETLAAVKAMGYYYFEPAGLFVYSYEDFKAELDKAGLKAVCAHVPFVTLKGDTEAVVEGYKLIGCECIAVPYLGEGERPGDPDFDKVLADIDKIGAVCESKGLILIYHNHDFEFVKMPDGTYGLDYMYATVPANHLQTELDTCWVNIGGEVPAEYIRKYAGRCPVVHLKDFIGGKSDSMYELIGIEKKADTKQEEFKFRPVGSGKQDFPAILEAAVESGARYVIVEQDQSYETPCLEAAKMSREYLKTLGW
jgi:sugar phosphate isomerase/epimerase